MYSTDGGIVPVCVALTTRVQQTVKKGSHEYILY